MPYTGEAGTGDAGAAFPGDAGISGDAVLERMSRAVSPGGAVPGWYAVGLLPAAAALAVDGCCLDSAGEAGMGGEAMPTPSSSPAWPARTAASSAPLSAMFVLLLSPCAIRVVAQLQPTP